MSISAFQNEILQMMRDGHTLRNTHESEAAPYRPANGMFSGSIESNSVRLTVPYRTIASMLTSGLIEEAGRSTHTSYFGSTPFEMTEIQYRLKERPSDILCADCLATCTLSPDGKRWLCPSGHN